MKTIKTFYFLTFLFLINVQCKKENKPLNIKLKDKPLSEIQKYLIGNWQIHYSYGGITGNIRYNYTNSFIEFKPNDIIYWKDNIVERVNTKIKWIRTTDQVNELTYVMSFSDILGYPESWGTEGIYKDTLSSI